MTDNPIDSFDGTSYSDDIIDICNLGNTFVGSTESVSTSDFDDLKKEVEHLKKLHDYDYARQCILDDLEKEYKSMIRTDIWYEAAKEYLNKKINTNKLNLLISNFRCKYSIWGDNLSGFVYANDYMGCSYLSASDIEFSINDGRNSNKKISIKELHNAYPNVELEDNFKQFCIVYKRSHEK